MCACSSSTATELSAFSWNVTSPKYDTWSPRVPAAKILTSCGNCRSFLTRLTVPSSLTDEVFTSASLMLTARGTEFEISPGQMACGHSFL